MRRDVDRAIDAMAARQWGVWTGEQGGRVGVNRSLASRRVLTGLWIRPYPDVYAHASWVRPLEGEILAAAWSLPEGRASHDAAAWLHALDGASRPAEPVITVPRGGQRARPFPIHTSVHLPSWTQTFVRGVPCSTVARNLVELAGSWEPGRLSNAWSTALSDNRTSMSRIEAAALPLMGTGWAGTKIVGDLIAAHDESEPPPESVLEHLLIDFVEGSGYGKLVRQMPLPSFRDLRQRADGFLPSVGLLLEADGRRWHTRVRDFERDRRRDNEAQALGYDIARFTHRELTEERDVCLTVLDTHFLRRGHVRTRSGLWVPAA